MAETSRAVLPREYGAYAELSFPLLTAFLLGGVTVPGVVFATAVIAWFLVREPLAILNGVRGKRLEASLTVPARRAAVVLGVLGLAAAVYGWLSVEALARGWALVPGACAAVLAPALLRGRPKTLGAELVVALALATMILPIGLAGRMSLVTGLRAALVWAVSFGLATLAVHAVKARAKPERGAVWTTRATPVLAAVTALSAIGGAVMGRWPWPVGLAALPSATLVMATLALRTHPRQLKRVGWSLVGANVVTLTLLVFA